MATTAATAGIADVVGENLRRLRTERRLTQHEAVRLLLGSGVRWSRSKLAAVEAGNRSSLGLGEVLLVAVAFQIPASELFAGEGTITLAQGVTIDRRSVRALLGSGEAQDRLRLTDEVSDDVQRAARDQLVLQVHPPGEADVDLARRLGVSTAAVVMAARRTWGRTLTEERDMRVATLGDMNMGERQAHRGHLTRELALEIETLLAQRASPSTTDPEEGRV
jgi:transcriptional regulator with XRE-family HTH domain